MCTTHTDDILGCGEYDIMAKMHIFLGQRFGELKSQESSFVLVGMELVQDITFSVTLTRGDFAKDLPPSPTTSKLWAARHLLMSPEDVHLRQCKLGELCWLATVSHPDICARLVRIASCINSPQGSDVYRINDLIKTVKLWRKAAISKYVSSSQLETVCTGSEGAKAR